MRGISTVVDVTVFLLLVSGAITTLVAGTGSIPREGRDTMESRNPAAEDASILVTNTATVNYSLSPATRSSGDGVTFHRTQGPEFERNTHGTLASLLADAAVGNATVDGTRLSHATDDFERALAVAVRDRLGQQAPQTSVEAVWEPYPGAPISGRVSIGDDPPRDADVHAATLQVDSGFSPTEERARRVAATDGYQGVARAIADTVVRGLFPPRETRLSLRGDFPVDALTAQRYRRVGSVLDAGPVGIRDGNVSESNDRLTTALSRRLRSDLAQRYDSPAAAARTVDTNTVRITVRTWSR